MHATLLHSAVLLSMFRVSKQENKRFMGCGAQLAYSRQLLGVFLGILAPKVGLRHTDLVLACDQGSLVGLCVQGYNSLCATVTICSTLVNIHIHTHVEHFDQLIRKSQPAGLKIKISSVKTPWYKIRSRK